MVDTYYSVWLLISIIYKYLSFQFLLRTISLIKKDEVRAMKIRVTNNNLTIDYELNASSAAKDLFSQLPITTEIKNYSDDEKIFYPKELDTSSTPSANAKTGDLGYFAPWGDVVLYYKDFGSYPGFYVLGKVIDGKSSIEKLSGQVTITRLD